MSTSLELPEVIKRDGTRQKIDFNKISYRIFRLCDGLDVKKLNLFEVIQKVVAGVCEGIHTRELDAIAARTCQYFSSQHPDYERLAARIEASNLQKETKNVFSEKVHDLYHNYDKDGIHRPVVGEDFYEDVMANKDRLDAAIDYRRDMDLTYFGLKTLQKAYLLKLNGKIHMRPQDMFMRVAVALHGRDVEAAIETYEAMSKRYFVHASPTLFNAGTLRRGYASCFLCSPEDDSIEAMYKLVYECAIISKYSGGIGLNVHDIRAKGSRIHSSNGTAEGIIPFLGVLHRETAHVTQSSRRPASIAVYLSPDHLEIIEFLEIKLPQGSEETRARNLFNAVWIPDLFMQRVEENGQWELFCPDEAKGLNDVWGEEYVRLREKYVREKRYRKVVPARQIWDAILRAQAETGSPYVSFKDAVNRCANQKHVGTICHSNLCNEITIRSSKDEIGVCNLASVGLPAYVQNYGTKDKSPSFDHQALYRMVKIITRNLNKVIDKTDYPLEKARTSNMRHRPIGIGISGLADTFFRMRLPFDSEEARCLNREIFETIYYAAVEASCELAERDGYYPSYPGSEFSKGRFQFDLWDEHTKILYDQAPADKKRQLGVWKPTEFSGRWDWDALKARVRQHGMRNSLLTACMPTASTSQILGYSECMEPLASLCLKRITLSGEFQLVCSYLLRDLYELGLWNSRMKDMMFERDGSIQDIPGIPSHLKDLYKTTWEIKQRVLIDMSADRAPFIDQTQSLNLFMAKPNYAAMVSMLYYGWRRGLKTGIYYLRQKQSAAALKFTVEQNVSANVAAENKAAKAAEDLKDAPGVKDHPIKSVAELHAAGPMKTVDLIQDDEPIPGEVEDDGLGEVVMSCSLDGTCTSCSA